MTSEPDKSGTAVHMENVDNSMLQLDSAAQHFIGQKLKAVYSEILQQPIPDQFLKLLEELEQKERGK